jgi:hypothetical protein
VCVVCVACVSCRLFSGLDTRINIGSWYLMLIDLSCHGFVLFGCLCSTETIRFWVQIHKIMYTKPFRDALAEVKVQLLRPTRHDTHDTHDPTHGTWHTTHDTHSSFRPKDMVSGSGDDGWSKSTVSRQSKRSSTTASRCLRPLLRFAFGFPLPSRRVRSLCRHPLIIMKTHLRSQVSGDTRSASIEQDADEAGL